MAPERRKIIRARALALRERHEGGGLRNGIPGQAGILKPCRLYIGGGYKALLVGGGDHLRALYREYCSPKRGKHMLVVCEMILGATWTNFVFLFLWLFIYLTGSKGENVSNIYTL